jgi:zinc transport system substrate-binding protein
MTNKLRTASLFMALFMAAGLLASCAGAKKTSGKPIVFVSIPPQKFFVDRIAAGRVETQVLIAPGQSPHTYTPTPKQLAQLSQADLFFTIGIPFEDAVIKKIRGQNRNLKIVDMGNGVKRGQAPAHGQEHEMGHTSEMDAHIWLDPANALAMARNTADMLSEIDPDNKAQYQKNKDALNAELEALDKILSDTLTPFKGQRFYVFHPAFGYFARAYGLEQAAVETGGKEPTARALDALIRQARRDNVRVIFVQPQFSRKSAERVAREIGGAVVPIDPLAEEYIGNMQNLAEKIKQSMQH